MNRTTRKIVDHLHREACALVDKATAEKRDLTRSEEAKFNELVGRIDELNRAAAEARDRDEDRAPYARIIGAGDPDVDSSEFDEQLRGFLGGDPLVRTIDVPLRGVRVERDRETGRTRVVETRDLTVGSAAGGGNTVPVSFVTRLYEHLVATSVIRQVATVVTTDSGEDLRIPKTTSHGADAGLVAEAAPLPEADPAFGQVTLQAFKYGKLIQVSRELIDDTAIDLEGYLARAAGTAIGRGTGAHFITGDGAAKPNGVVTASTLGKAFAGVAAITSDELVDLYFSVAPEYRANGTWLVNDQALALIRKLKDTTGRYLFEESTLSSGAPAQILGRPVLVEPFMPAPTTGNKSVLFGDFSTYWIRDARGIRFERSDDFAFGNDLVTFRAVLRTDGDLVDTSGAVKHGIQA